MHGECRVQKLLWYLDYNRICFTPFVHAFYHGIFKDWMTTICEPLQLLRKNRRIPPIIGKAPQSLLPEHALSQSQRNEIRVRMGTMTFTNEFSSVPENPLTHGKRQKMEQLIRMLDCVFPLLFADVSLAAQLRM